MSTETPNPPGNILQSLIHNRFGLMPLYRWVLGLAGSRHAGIALAIISFAEASCFPIPPDVMLAPMVLKQPEKWWKFAFICAASSIVGGCLGYFIGYSLEGVGLRILHFFGNDHGLVAYREAFAKYGFFFVLGQGVLPIPYKLTTIAAGLAHFTLWQFILASCITRSARFFGVALLCKRFGPEIMEIIEKRMLMVGAIVLAVVVLGLYIVRHLAK